jgi:membrane protease YdiL (CAAX protease family)
MYDNHSRGISYIAGFFMLIAFTIAGLVVAGFISAAVWQQMTGLKYEDLEKYLTNPAYANPLKIMQVINAVVGFLLPAILTAKVLSNRPLGLLGLTSRIGARQIGLVVLIIGASLLVASSLSYFNQELPLPADWKLKFERMEATYNQQVEAIVSLKTGTDYLLALLIMAFLPALCEEALFRGGLQNFLSRGTGKPWLAIIVVSLLFSLAHISFYGFLSRFFLGIILGALFGAIVVKYHRALCAQCHCHYGNVCNYSKRHTDA